MKTEGGMCKIYGVVNYKTRLPNTISLNIEINSDFLFLLCVCACVCLCVIYNYLIILINFLDYVSRH